MKEFLKDRPESQAPLASPSKATSPTTRAPRSRATRGDPGLRRHGGSRRQAPSHRGRAGLPCGAGARAFIPMLEHTRESFKALGNHDILKPAGLRPTAACIAKPISNTSSERHHGFVADTRFRKRDPRFVTAARHRPTRPDRLGHDPKRVAYSLPRTSSLAPGTASASAPPQAALPQRAHVRVRDHYGVKFRGTKRDCVGCPMRSRCLRNPDKSTVRQVVFFLGREASPRTTPPACAARSIPMPAVTNTPSAWGLSSRSLPTSIRRIGSGVSACVGAPRSALSGSSSAWCIT